MRLGKERSKGSNEKEKKGEERRRRKEKGGREVTRRTKKKKHIRLGRYVHTTRNPYRRHKTIDAYTHNQYIA